MGRSGRRWGTLTWPASRRHMTRDREAPTRIPRDSPRRRGRRRVRAGAGPSPRRDLLDGAESPTHEGGFAAAADRLGAAPALYHADTGAPGAARSPDLPEEVARIVRARAANPRWIAGMLRHGYRGGAEIARAVEGLYAFAACVPERFDRQFDLLRRGNAGRRRRATPSLPEPNPAARDGMLARFADAMRRGLWRTARNDAGARD